MSQSANTHLERVSSDGVRKVIELVRYAARIDVRTRAGIDAARMRSVVEFLLRPQLVLIERLEAAGLNKYKDPPGPTAMSDGDLSA